MIHKQQGLICHLAYLPTTPAIRKISIYILDLHWISFMSSNLYSIQEDVRLRVCCAHFIEHAAKSFFAVRFLEGAWRRKSTL
jgi:hypothetical protein